MSKPSLLVTDRTHPSTLDGPLEALKQEFRWLVEEFQKERSDNKGLLKEKLDTVQHKILDLAKHVSAPGQKKHAESL